MDKSNLIYQDLRELFSKKRFWDSATDIHKAIENKKRDYPHSYSTVKRKLDDMGVIEDEKGLYLKDENANELFLLIEKFKEIKDKPTFIKDIQTAVLKTKPYYNEMLAKQIEKTFKEEVYSTICSGDTDIVIFYKKTETESRIEKIIEENSILKT